MDNQPDEIMASIVAAIERGRAGRPDLARQELTALWERIGPDGDPLHRCTLAHYLADLQEDLADELAWDLRALDAVRTLTDERAQRYHAEWAVRGFMPSLYLNLAEDYRKLGQFDRAEEYLSLARDAAPVLVDDDYGNMIRDGIAHATTALREQSV